MQARLARIENTRRHPASALIRADDAVRIQTSLAALTKDLTTQRAFGEALAIQARVRAVLKMEPAACAGLNAAMKVFQGLPPDVRDQTDFEELAAADIASCQRAASAPVAR